MELSEKYVKAVWDNKSFSAAARSLFVSQPALSATVAKLEHQLGFKIFDRSSSPISLTVKGRIYMDYILDIAARESDLVHRLRAVDDLTSGSLTVGGSMSFACYFTPIVCGAFYRKYPGINITMDMKTYGLEEARGNVDLCLTFDKDENAVPLLNERLIVAVKRDHPCVSAISEYALGYDHIVSKGIPPEKEISDPSILSDVPFIKMWAYSDSDKRLDDMLPQHRAAPYHVTNSSTFETRYRLMQEGLGAVFVSDAFVEWFQGKEEDVCFFALKDKRCYRTLYIQTYNYRNEIVDRFIETAIECCAQKGKYAFEAE